MGETGSGVGWQSRGLPGAVPPPGHLRAQAEWLVGGGGGTGKPQLAASHPPAPNPGLSIAPPEGCWALSSEEAPASHRPTVKGGHSVRLTVC